MKIKKRRKTHQKNGDSLAGYEKASIMADRLIDMHDRCKRKRKDRLDKWLEIRRSRNAS